MLLDDVYHVAVQLVFQREGDAFFHMGDDDEGAHGGGEVVVRVAVVPHIFGEVFGLHEFADVVEVAAHARHCGVCADGLARCLGEVRDGEAVLESAGGFEGHAPEERVIEVGHFQPTDAGGDVKERLDHGEAADDEQGHHDGRADGDDALEAERV